MRLPNRLARLLGARQTQFAHNSRAFQLEVWVRRCAVGPVQRKLAAKRLAPVALAAWAPESSRVAPVQSRIPQATATPTQNYNREIGTEIESCG